MAAEGEYQGVDNLEVMASAVRYRRHLTSFVTSAAGSAGSSPTLLDFGAGTGTHSADLAELGYQVDCVELDAGLRDRLEAAGHPSVATVADLAGRTFDVVYSFNVLEHIDRDDQAVADLFQATRPGGTLVLYVPAFQVLFSSMDRKVGHLRRYRRRQLVEVARQAGFRIERCAYVDSLGFLASIVFKVVGNDRGDINTGALALYDRVVFPVSKALDHVFGRLFGKNLVLVAHRP
jgi:SAM-dependent methyltransferase